MPALIIGDIGALDGMFHVGDEAMFEAARDELRERGIDAVGVSSAPDESSARYGIPTVPRLGFAGLDRVAAEERFRMLTTTRPDAADPAAAAIAALEAADGLLIAGGGNLAARWPVHIYERTALTTIARSLGTPVVVSGQTLGPDLEPRDVELVAGMLSDAAIAGVREPTSLALARSWGFQPRLGVDDASFLTDDATPGGVLVSLSGWFAGRPADAVEAGIAALVDRAAELVGGTVRFHAHFGPVAGPEPRGDAALHERIRARLAAPSEVVATGDSRSSAALARGAALLVTSRYHPAVFAAPAGAPVLGVVADEYTRVKLTGALGHWGSASTVTMDDLDPRAVDALHGDRDAVSAAAASRLPAHRAEASAWWDRVAATFGA
jgi:polysaccharide pyruvyl transferase WcaK-like protein